MYVANMLEYNGVKIHWLGHDGFRISGAAAEGSGSSSRTIYIDPYKLTKAQRDRNDADIILITHNHFDHLSVDDLRHVAAGKGGKKKNDGSSSSSSSGTTTVVAARECVDQLRQAGITDSSAAGAAGDIRGVSPGDRLTVQGVQIEAVAAYNTNKTFHPKADGKLGFVITLGGVRIYHAGDTDDIPEMGSVHPDIALVPVSGTYVMTAEEAARAVNEKLKPKKLAIPMHYGEIVGSEKDAAKFKELVRVCPVQILDRE